MDIEERFDLSGRVALITGASTRGIGSGAAKILVEAGAKVFLVARREEKLQGIAAQIAAQGGEVAYQAADVSHEAECQAAVEACVARFGRLDIMVLAAGTMGMVSSELEDSFGADDWQKVLGVNLMGVVNMVKYGWPECAKHEAGSIIPILSAASFVVNGGAAYTATKGALRRLVPWWAMKMAPNVRVNGLVPGLVDTEMTHPEGWDVSEILAPLVDRTPLKRIGTVDDMANGILYLASDASSFMTGQYLILDGGQIAVS